MKLYQYLHPTFLTLTFSLIFCVFTQSSFHAQCRTPRSIAYEVENATCISNGSIQVISVAGEDGEHFEYALLKASDSSIVKPWQLSTHMDFLTPGRYILMVRNNCGTSSSEPLMKLVDVNGSYTMPSIYTIILNRRSVCNNGRMTVTSIGGTFPYKYALVPSLTIEEPLALSDYIVQPRLSNVFDSLQIGTYYVRVYDNCGSYITQSVEMTGAPEISNPIQGLYLQWADCTQMKGIVRMNYLGDYVNGTLDTIRKVWITFPNGTVDTIKYNLGNEYVLHFNMSMDKWGTLLTSGTFPDNISGEWPKTFIIHYLDACNTVHTKEIEYNKPQYEIKLTYNNSLISCDSISYKLSIDDIKNPTDPNLSDVLINDDVLISLQGGEDWHALTDWQANNYNINLAPLSAYDICIQLCGQIICTSGTTAPIPNLNASVSSIGEISCDGYTSLDFSIWTGVAPVQVEMVSGPEGQAGFSYIFNAVPFLYKTFTSTEHVLPGEYIIKFTDACDRVLLDTIITGRGRSTDISLEFITPCSDENLIMKIKDFEWERNIKSILGVRNISTLTEPPTSHFKAQIFHVIDTSLAIDRVYYNNEDEFLVTASDLNSLENGNYLIKVWRFYPAEADICAYTYIPWTKSDIVLDLTKSVALTNCPDESDQGTIIGLVEGGYGEKYFSLYEDVFDEAHLISGPTTEHIFTGLDKDKKYILAVQDECGRGAQVLMSFSHLPYPLIDGASHMILCLNDKMVLSVPQMPTATYQWYKDGLEIYGATSHVLTVDNVQYSDNGTYYLKINFGECYVLSSTYTLDLDLCDLVLPVNWKKFDVQQQQLNNILTWDVEDRHLVDYFEIIKSHDGQKWTRLGTIKNENADKELSFMDYHASEDDTYYFIKLKTIQGKDYRSIIKHVKRQSTPMLAYTLYPNPAQDYFTVEGIQAGSIITVYDLSGTIVKNYTLVQVSSSSQFPIHDLSEGVYIVKVLDADGHQEFLKLIVLK